MVVNVTAEQAFDLVQSGAVEVIDVREPHEFESDHVPGARLLPLSQLRSDPSALSSSESVIFVCAAGTRSQTAARIAVSHGLRRVYNISTGLRGWKRAGFPTRSAHYAVAG